MVLDLQRFRPLQPPILPGFLIILEELPGLIHWEDKTQDLQASGYWASYNQPYFNDIAYLSGNLDRCRDDKDACFYSDPRAIIFRERQELVVDTKSLQQLLAYNRFEFDDSSKKGACNAIACRGDLEYFLENKYPFGAIDGKVTSALLALAEDRRTGALTLQMSARLGPTTDDQPVFCWDKFEDAVKDSMNKNNRAYMHAGQPNCFNFPWQTFSLYS